MTQLELLVTKLSKTPSTTIDDFVRLVNTSVTARTCINGRNRVAVKNYSTAAVRRNKYLTIVLSDSFAMFSELYATDIYTKYIIWWAYTVYDARLYRKYVGSDVVNTKLLNLFIEWFAVYINNIKVLSEFNASCKFVAIKCKYMHHAADVIRDLIMHDTLAAAHMTGSISEYVLATLPDSILLNKSKPALFSNQLITNIRNNRDYLLGALNLACDNIIKTPVDFISYVDKIYRPKCK